MLSVFFSSKCSLFHNSNVFGPCINHILYIECAKIKKIPAPKVFYVTKLHVTPKILIISRTLHRTKKKNYKCNLIYTIRF